jgi:transposase
VERLIPPGKHGGRRRDVDVHEVLNGIMYVPSTGCQWRHVPKDLPPRSTLHGYLQRWSYDRTLEKVHYVPTLGRSGDQPPLERGKGGRTTRRAAAAALPAWSCRWRPRPRSVPSGHPRVLAFLAAQRDRAASAEPIQLPHNQHVADRQAANASGSAVGRGEPARSGINRGGKNAASNHLIDFQYDLPYIRWFRS